MDCRRCCRISNHNIRSTTASRVRGILPGRYRHRLATPGELHANRLPPRRSCHRDQRRHSPHPYHCYRSAWHCLYRPGCRHCHLPAQYSSPVDQSDGFHWQGRQPGHACQNAGRHHRPGQPADCCGPRGRGRHGSGNDQQPDRHHDGRWQVHWHEGPAGSQEPLRGDAADSCRSRPGQSAGRHRAGRHRPEAARLRLRICIRLRN
ncbi:hypothetical protein D9M70_242930 [compost metagenome]